MTQAFNCLSLCRPPGGACWGTWGLGHAGDDIAVQELHPDRDLCRCGAALHDGAVLRQVHQASHSGAQGQVDSAPPPLWGQDIFNDRNWKRPPHHFTPDAPESPPHRLYFPPANFFTLSHSWGHLHGNDITHNPSCQRFSHILIWYIWRGFFCLFFNSLFAVGLRGKDREGNW